MMKNFKTIALGMGAVILFILLLYLVSRTMPVTVL